MALKDCAEEQVEKFYRSTSLEQAVAVKDCAEEQVEKFYRSTNLEQAVAEKDCAEEQLDPSGSIGFQSSE